MGIAWYKISGRRGDILDYMNLSLDAELLPKTHAGGGESDIEYLYDSEPGCYPAHDMLLEATLADGTNQRRMEMEPVSRHLGEHLLRHGDRPAYCVFVSTCLNQNVISDFRNRRTYQYFSRDSARSVDGLKIIPLATEELRTILESGIRYPALYGVFDRAFTSEEPVPTWYRRTIRDAVCRPQPASGGRSEER